MTTSLHHLAIRPPVQSLYEPKPLCTQEVPGISPGNEKIPRAREDDLIDRKDVTKELATLVHQRGRALAHWCLFALSRQTGRTKEESLRVKGKN